MKLSERIADKPLVDENEIETGSCEVTEEELNEVVQLEATNADLLEVVKSVAVLGKCHCHAMKPGYTCYVCRAKEAIRNAEEQAS